MLLIGVFAGILTLTGVVDGKFGLRNPLLSLPSGPEAAADDQRLTALIQLAPLSIEYSTPKFAYADAKSPSIGADAPPPPMAT
jgi:hypothetical protein